jgi:hypothetical protein
LRITAAWISDSVMPVSVLLRDALRDEFGKTK